MIVGERENAPARRGGRLLEVEVAYEIWRSLERRRGLR